MTLTGRVGQPIVRGAARSGYGRVYLGDAVPVSSDELKILVWIMRVVDAKGRCTVRDISRHYRISTSTVQRVLEALRDAGLVAWEPGASGTLRPTVQITAFT